MVYEWVRRSEEYLSAVRGHDEPSTAQVVEHEGAIALFQAWESIAGSFLSFNADAVLGGHFVSYLARTPLSMALLLEACGPAAQRHIGRILGARMLRER